MNSADAFLSVFFIYFAAGLIVVGFLFYKSEYVRANYDHASAFVALVFGALFWPWFLGKDQ